MRRRRRRDKPEIEIKGELEALRRIRDSYPLPKTVGELYQEGRLKPQYIEHRPAERVILNYHKKSHAAAEPYEVSMGVRQALKLPLLHAQLSHRYPWAVYWLRDGKRYKKLFSTLGGAIVFHSRIAPIISNATIISRSRGYHIPPPLRGRLPKPWVWCPHCMKPRKYRLHPSGQTFSVFKKDPITFEPKEREVALLVCPMCACTNRDHVYRASNQPWEIRKFKQGARRAKPGVRGKPHPPRPRRRRRR